MKKVLLLLIVAALANLSNAQTVPNSEIRTPKAKSGFTISQFTYGAVQRCKLASPESSQAYQTQLERLKKDYQKLVELVVESSDYSWYKAEIDEAMKSLPHNIQSATDDCLSFTSMLKASLDDPGGRRTLEGLADSLSK